jgi:hypothetical protein
MHEKLAAEAASPAGLGVDADFIWESWNTPVAEAAEPVGFAKGVDHFMPARYFSGSLLNFFSQSAQQKAMVLPS